ncbi:MAG: RsmD family RNA methyltransferase [Pyrinomonadaceae bacterium]
MPSDEIAYSLDFTPERINFRFEPGPQQEIRYDLEYLKMENRRPSRNSSQSRKPFRDRERLDQRSPRGEGRDQSAPYHKRDEQRGDRPKRNPSYRRDGSQRSADNFRNATQPNSRFSKSFDGGRTPGKPFQSRRGLKAKTPEAAGPPITSDLQITNGKYRARFLVNSLSPAAAPTRGKLREILFKIIFRRTRGRRFLDLGAGAGCIGIEALSRGAMLVTFVERSSKSCSFLRSNLEKLEIKMGHGELVRAEIAPFVKRAFEKKRVWDLVYLGADSTMEDPHVLNLFRRGGPVMPGGLLMIEHDAGREFPEKIGQLKRQRIVVNDESAITFYGRQQ